VNTRQATEAPVSKSLTKLDAGLLLVLPVLFILLSPYSMHSMGYLFEEDYPSLFAIPNALHMQITDDGGQKLSTTHKTSSDNTTCEWVAGHWWPHLSLRCGEQVFPLLTESYQAAWPYYLTLLLPAPNRIESLRWLNAASGALTLLLLFFVVRRYWGLATARVTLPLCSLHSMYLMVFGSGYLYESWQISALLTVALLVPLRVRRKICRSNRGRRGALLARRDDESYREYGEEEQRSQKGYSGVRIHWNILRRTLKPGSLAFWQLLGLGFVAGLGASLKLTLVPAMLVLLFILSGREFLRPSRLLPLAVGFMLPLLPFVVHEILLTGESGPSSIYVKLIQQKANLRYPERIPQALLGGAAWMTSLPFGNESLYRAMLRNEAALGWLFWSSAVMGTGVFVAAIRRALRKPRDLLLTALLLAQLVTLASASLLYSSKLDFQSFMPFIPLMTAVIARQGIALYRKVAARGLPRIVAGLGAGLLFAPLIAQTAVAYSHADHCCSNFSRHAQDEVLAGLRPGSLVLTTAYNHVGMVRTLRGREFRELNLDRVLTISDSPAGQEQSIRAIFLELLSKHKGDYILFDDHSLTLEEAQEKTSPDQDHSDSRELIRKVFLETAREINLPVMQVATGHDDCGKPTLLLYQIGL
jgi:hypothetical protein